MSLSDSSKLDWKELVIKDTDALRFTNLQLHQASQFLSILGENLVPKKSDDSNANIEIVEGGLLGRKVEGSQPFHGFINISNFSLQLVDDQMESLWSTSFNGKTRVQLLSELKKAVEDIGQNGNALKFIDHYKIEVPHPIENNASFEMPDDDSANTWHKIYSNAKAVFEEVLKDFPSADEIRIWPHHFDIGSYISLNEEGTKSIGLGLSIPDTMVDDFYFYVYGWRKDPRLDISGFTSLPAGHWKTGDWNGGILPFQELTTSGKHQENLVLEFYMNAMKEYLDVLV